MIEKIKISYLLCGSAVAGILLELLSFFYVGLTMVGLWDLSKYYIPLVAFLLVVDVFFNKNINRKYFKIAIVLNVIFIIIMIIQVTQYQQ